MKTVERTGGMTDRRIHLMGELDWGKSPGLRIQPGKLSKLNHEQFILTYHDKLIVKGLDNHAQHFIDAYQQLGKWRHQFRSIETLNHFTALAQYVVETEKKPATPSKELFTFMDEKCIGMHEVKVELEGVLDVDENFVRVSPS